MRSTRYVSASARYRRNIRAEFEGLFPWHRQGVCRNKDKSLPSRSPLGTYGIFVAFSWRNLAIQKKGQIQVAQAELCRPSHHHPFPRAGACLEGLMILGIPSLFASHTPSICSPKYSAPISTPAYISLYAVSLCLVPVFSFPMSPRLDDISTPLAEYSLRHHGSRRLAAASSLMDAKYSLISS